MMKVKLWGLATLACTLTLSSCDDGILIKETTGQGSISLRADVNTSVLSSSESRSSRAEITRNDLAVTLSCEEKGYYRTWASVTEFEEDPTFPVGNYILTVYNGEENAQGFECPYYYGSTEVIVRDSETTEVGVTATLTQAMFSIEYTEAAKKYLKSYNVELACANGATIQVPGDETRPAYIMPGTVDVFVNITKQNGTSARLLAGTVEAEVRNHYLVNVDVNGGEVGDGSLTVTFDSSLQTEDYEIDLTDDLILAAAPEIFVNGVDGNGETNGAVGFAMSSNPNFLVIARGDVAQLKLSTENTALFTSEWPESIDLINATDAEITQLEALGLQLKGVRGNVDKMALVDITNVTKFMNNPNDPDEYVKFSLTAIDKNGKSSPTATIQVNFKVMISSAVEENDVFATYATLSANASVDKVDQTSNIIFEISANGGNYATVTPTNLGNGRFKFDGLDGSTSYKIKATLPASINEFGAYSIVTFKTEAKAQLPNGDMESWCQTDKGSYWVLLYPGPSKEEAVWGTNNPMTTSQGANYAYCRISGTINTNDAHGGSNAALIRTVGWGKGNIAVSSGGGSGVTKYVDAGLLHLGNSRDSRNDYSETQGKLDYDDFETLNCGLAFASRPASISFWYKYSEKNSSDKGLAEYSIYDKDNNVIASGTMQLDPATVYTQKTLSIAYPASCPKAAKIFVRFLSTYDANFLAKSDANLSGPGFANVSYGTFMGSQLYIDDITLNY